MNDAEHARYKAQIVLDDREKENAKKTLEKIRGILDKFDELLEKSINTGQFRFELFRFTWYQSNFNKEIPIADIKITDTDPWIQSIWKNVEDRGFKCFFEETQGQWSIEYCFIVSY